MCQFLFQATIQMKNKNAVNITQSYTEVAGTIINKNINLIFSSKRENKIQYIGKMFSEKIVLGSKNKRKALCLLIEHRDRRINTAVGGRSRLMGPGQGQKASG